MINSDVDIFLQLALNYWPFGFITRFMNGGIKIYHRIHSIFESELDNNLIGAGIYLNCIWLKNVVRSDIRYLDPSFFSRKPNLEFAG